MAQPRHGFPDPWAPYPECQHAGEFSCASVISTRTNDSLAAAKITSRLDGCATTYETDKIIHENVHAWTMDSSVAVVQFRCRHRAARDRKSRRSSRRGARTTFLMASQPSGPEKSLLPPSKAASLTCMVRALHACHGVAQACWTHKRLWTKASQTTMAFLATGLACACKATSLDRPIFVRQQGRVLGRDRSSRSSVPCRKHDGMRYRYRPRGFPSSIAFISGSSLCWRDHPEPPC